MIITRAFNLDGMIEVDKVYYRTKCTTTLQHLGYDMVWDIVDKYVNMSRRSA